VAFTDVPSIIHATVLTYDLTIELVVERGPDPV
jgi:hypothetical protein